MLDRQLLGDIGLAVLLAVPTLSLSRPQPLAAQQPAATAPVVHQAAVAERPSTEQRYTLGG